MIVEAVRADLESVVATSWEDARTASGLAEAWLALESGARSPFHAWSWVHTWLRLLPPSVDVLLFRAEDASGPLALGLFGVHRERGVRRLSGRHTLSLQETGDPALDELTVEYAALLTRPGAQSLAWSALSDSLQQRRPRVRQLLLSACDLPATIATSLRGNLRAFELRRRPSCFVDLRMLRESKRSYLEALGASTRATLRRSMRAYATLGPLRCEVARDTQTALRMLKELATLHTDYWRVRGRPGAFGSAFFAEFHQQLIGAADSAALSRLTRVMAGDTCLGVLYALHWRNRAYYYNSGIRHGAVPRDDRPGLVAHCLAIEGGLSEGLDAYDFMAGDADYKRMLSTHAYDVFDLQLRENSWRTTLERGMQRALRRRQSTPLSPDVVDAPVRALRAGSGPGSEAP